MYLTGTSTLSGFAKVRLLSYIVNIILSDASFVPILELHAQIIVEYVFLEEKERKTETSYNPHFWATVFEHMKQRHEVVGTPGLAQSRKQPCSIQMLHKRHVVFSGKVPRISASMQSTLRLSDPLSTAWPALLLKKSEGEHSTRYRIRLLSETCVCLTLCYRRVQAELLYTEYNLMVYVTMIGSVAFLCCFAPCVSFLSCRLASIRVCKMFPSSMQERSVVLRV